MKPSTQWMQTMLPKAILTFISERSIPLSPEQAWTIFVVCKGDLNATFHACQTFEANVDKCCGIHINQILRLQELERKNAIEAAIVASVGPLLNQPRARKQAQPTRSLSSIRKELAT